MSNFFNTIGEYVVAHLTPQVVFLLFGVVIGGGLVFIFVTQFVYSFFSSDKLHGKATKLLYAFGKADVEGQNVLPQGGSVIALVGMLIILSIIMIASGTLAVFAYFRYILLGQFIYVPVGIFFLTAVITLISTKSHLKRWGLGEYTLQPPARVMPSTFDDEKELDAYNRNEVNQ